MDTLHYSYRPNVVTSQVESDWALVDVSYGIFLVTNLRRVVIAGSVRQAKVMLS